MSSQAIINDVSKTVGAIRTSVTGINKDSEKVLKSWEGLVQQGKGMVGHIERWVVANTPLKSVLKTVDDTMASVAEKAFKQRQELNLAKGEWLGLARLKKSGLVVDEEALESARQNLKNQRQLNVLTMQYGAAWHNLNNVQVKFTSGIGVLMVGLLERAANITSHWNVALSAANDLTERRHGLLIDILEVHKQTGTQVAEIGESAKALIEYGLESKDGFQDSLKVVTQLRQALGLSAQDSAEMAVMASRMNVEFRSVADSLTRIVDSTALSAQEAKKYADELGRAALFLGKSDRARAFGPGGALEIVGRLEGAIKEAGGQQGELTSMIADMQSTLEGSMRAQVFGVRPQDVGTERGVQALTSSLGRMVAQAQALRDSGNQTGFLGVLTQIRMMTGDRIGLVTLNALVEAQKKVATQRHSTLKLEERWRDQLVQTGQTWERLRNTVQGILMDGLMPLVGGLRWVLSVIVDFVDILKKVPGLMRAFGYVVTAVAAVTIPMATYSFIRLTAALTAAAWAASRLSKATAANAAEQTLLDFGGKVGRGGMLREAVKWVAGARGAWAGTGTLTSGGVSVAGGLSIATIVGAVVSSLAAGVSLGLLINKVLDHTRTLSYAKIVAAGKESKEAFINSYRGELQRLVKAGNIDDIKAYAQRFQETALATGIFGQGAEAQNKVVQLLKESASAAALVADIKSGRAQIGDIPSAIDVQAAEAARVQAVLLKEGNEIQQNIWIEVSKANNHQTTEERDQIAREMLWRMSDKMSNRNSPAYGPGSNR